MQRVHLIYLYFLIFHCKYFVNYVNVYLHQRMFSWTLIFFFIFAYLFWFYLIKTKKGVGEAPGTFHNFVQRMNSGKKIFDSFRTNSIPYSRKYSFYCKRRQNNIQRPSQISLQIWAYLHNLDGT